MGTDNGQEDGRIVQRHASIERWCLTSIMFHYHDLFPVGCNWLGAETSFRSRSFSGSLRLSRDGQLVSSQITCQYRVSGADSLSVACIYAGQVACDRQTAGRRRPVLTR